MLMAKVDTESYASGNVRAFSGLEYVPYEFRQVPAGCEEEAQRHPFLIVKELVKEEPEPEPEDEPEVDATPSAAKLADEKGVDLAALEGTGEGGRVLVSDVKAAAEEE